MALCSRGKRRKSSRCTCKSADPVPLDVTLAFAETIAHPDHGFGNRVAAELIGKTRDVVKVEFRFDEYMLRHVELHTDSYVYVQMIRASDWFRGSGTDRRSHATTLGEGEACVGIADAALKPQRRALHADRR